MDTELTDIPLLLVFLLSVAMVASAFTGYAGGLESRRSRLPVYLMGILVASVSLFIQDLDRPSSGFIRVSQQPLIDTASAIATFAE